MFYSPPQPAGPSIEFPEFLEVLRGKLPLDSDEKIADCVGLLKALSQTTESLIAGLARDLLDQRQDVAPQYSLPNSFVLFSEGGDAVRLVIWRPPDSRSGLGALSARLHAYGYPHDHDFDLLTVGALGGGYRTSIHSYDRRKISGLPGEKIDANYQGDYQLERGTVLFYEQSKDVHIQHPCDDISVSINIITQNRASRSGGQFVFDPEVKTVLGVPEYAGSRVLRVTEMLLELGGVENLDLVGGLSSRSSDPFVRRVITHQIAEHCGLDLGTAARIAQCDAAALAASDVLRNLAISDLVIEP